MSDGEDSRLNELACWRIWYRLSQRGACWEQDLMANCGIQESLFDEAIDGLMNIGMIEETQHSDAKDQSEYGLIEDEPRMMQVFPTLEGVIDD